MNNIFKNNELEEALVCSILENTASDANKYETRYYSLDAVLSVGYRVNSKNATQFRIWANKVLKEYLVQGYSLLNEQAQQLSALLHTVRLLGNVLESKPLTLDVATGLIKVLTEYSYALDVLDKYEWIACS